MKIVLLGSIPKGDQVREGWIDWKKEYIEILQRSLEDVDFVHGDSISDSAGAEMVVGHDLAQIKAADVCVVDAQQKIGAGTSMEMVYAKYIAKPVVTIIPRNSHHRKSDVVFHGEKVEEWVHPFLEITSDYIVESIEGAAAWIKQLFDSSNKQTIKDMSVLENAVKNFELSTNSDD